VNARRAIATAVALVALAIALTSIDPPRQVAAQTTAIPEGAYQVAKHERGRRDVPSQMDLLHVLPGNRYAWENDHANWRVGSGGLQLDCRADWLASYSPARRQVEFEFVDGTNATNKLTLNLLGPTTAHPRREPLKAWRDCKYATANAPMRRYETAGLQVVQAVTRPVSGEILLTPDRNATPDDLATWRCLTDQYPRIEFTPLAGGQTDRVFVFPDGRFRADLSGGVAYGWGAVPSGCNVDGVQRGGILPPGPPAAPATAEKVFLACNVRARRLDPCHQWWLVRP
jgi:hypothetical protein